MHSAACPDGIVIIRVKPGTDMDMEPGVRPGEHVLCDLLWDEFLLYRCLEDRSAEELGDIDRGEERGRAEGAVREKKAIGGKAVDVRIGIGGLVAKVVQFMSTVKHRGGRGD